MSDTEKPSKDKLLDELESIKDSLSSEMFADHDDDIPILVDTLSPDVNLVLKTDEFMDNENHSTQQSAEHLLKEAYLDNSKKTQEIIEQQGFDDQPNEKVTHSVSHTFELSDTDEQQFDSDVQEKTETQEPLPFGIDIQSDHSDFESAISHIKRANASTFEELINKSEDTHRELPLPGQQSLFDVQEIQDPSKSDTENSLYDKNTESDSNIEQTQAPYSLFGDSIIRDDDKDTHSDNETPLKAKGENPFLPQHIRDRLAANREIMESDMNHPANAVFTTHSADLLNDKNKTEHDSQRLSDAASGSSEPQEQIHILDAKAQIVEDLIAEFLPKIERVLREKLEAHLDKKDET